MNKKTTCRQQLLPLCLAVVICLLTLHAAVVELPELTEPKTVATVTSLPEDDADAELYDEFGNLVEADGSAFVEYEALGDTWSATLCDLPEGVREGDRLLVAYSRERPDIVYPVRTGRMTVMLSLLTLSVCAYGVLWGRSVGKKKNM